MNRYFDEVKLKCANILPQCDKVGGKAKQMRRWLATSAVYVDEKGGRKVGNWQWKQNGSTQKRYPQEQNAANIIVMILSENDNTSKLSILLQYC